MAPFFVFVIISSLGETLWAISSGGYVRRRRRVAEALAQAYER